MSSKGEQDAKLRIPLAAQNISYGTLVPVGDVGRPSNAILHMFCQRPRAVASNRADPFTTRHSADRYLEILMPAAA